MEPYRENNIKLSKINVQELFVLVSTFTEPPTIPPSREMANKLFGRPKTDWARVEPKLIQAFGELKPADLCDRWREAALKTIARTCNVHPRFDTEEDGRLAMTFTLVAKDKPLAAMSREEKELWQSRHLVNQPLEAFLSLSLDAAIELTENVPEQPDAPAIDAEQEQTQKPSDLVSVVEGVVRAGMANVLNIAARAKAVDRCNAAMQELLKADSTKAELTLEEWRMRLGQAKKTIRKTEAYLVTIPSIKSQNEAMQLSKAMPLSGETVSKKVS